MEQNTPPTYRRPLIIIGHHATGRTMLARNIAGAAFDYIVTVGAEDGIDSFYIDVLFRLRPAARGSVRIFDFPENDITPEVLKRLEGLPADKTVLIFEGMGLVPTVNFDRIHKLALAGIQTIVTMIEPREMGTRTSPKAVSPMPDFLPRYFIKNSNIVRTHRRDPNNYQAVKITSTVSGVESETTLTFSHKPFSETMRRLFPDKLPDETVIAFDNLDYETVKRWLGE